MFVLSLAFDGLTDTNKNMSLHCFQLLKRCLFKWVLFKYCYPI